MLSPAIFINSQIHIYQMKSLIQKFLSFAGTAAVAALMLAMPQAADAQYRVFYENGKAGIADSSGTVLVPAKYDKLYQLGDSENARFGAAGKYGMLDIKTGKILLPDKYKSIGDFYCGLAYINDNGKFGFVDRAGNIVIAPQFDSAASFYDGVSQVTKNGRSYYIGVDGKEYSKMPSADELAAKEYVAPAQPQQESPSASSGKKDVSAPAKDVPASHANERSTDYEESPDAASPKDWRKGVPTPYLSWNTAYIQRKVPFDQLEESGVSEGIFWLREYNRKIGYGSYYGFWTIDGRCLFPAMYESFTEGLPRFDSGACVVKEAEAKMHSPVILYADGTTKHLSHEWEAMTEWLWCVRFSARRLSTYSTSIQKARRYGIILPRTMPKGVSRSISALCARGEGLSTATPPRRGDSSMRKVRS